MLSLTEKSRIQALFNAFEAFSNTFQGRFNFRESPLKSSTFQACANPAVRSFCWFCNAMAQYYIFSCFILILIAYKLYTSAHCCWIKEVFFIYQLYINTYEPRHKISNNVVCAASKASDQPAHMRCLIRAFASRLNIL